LGEIIDSNIKIEASALLNAEDEFQKESSEGESSSPADNYATGDTETDPKKLTTKLFVKAFKSATIEPIVFVHLTAILMTSICTIDLILERACSVNNKFPDEICADIVKRFLQQQLNIS